LRVSVEKRSHLAHVFRETSAVEPVLSVEGAAVCADLHVEIPKKSEGYFEELYQHEGQKSKLGEK